MKFILSVFTLFSLICTHLAHANLLNIAPESVEAQAWSIMDAQSGQVIGKSTVRQDRNFRINYIHSAFLFLPSDYVSFVFIFSPVNQ